MKQNNLVLLISLLLIILSCKSENDVEITKEEFLDSAEKVDEASTEKKKSISVHHIPISEEDIELSYKFKTWTDNQYKIGGREPDSDNNPILAYLEKKML